LKKGQCFLEIGHIEDFGIYSLAKPCNSIKNCWTVIVPGVIAALNPKPLLPPMAGRLNLSLTQNAPASSYV